MVTLVPAGLTVLPGLERMLETLGAGEAGFGGTGFGRGEQTLPEFLAGCIRQQQAQHVPEGWVPQTTFWMISGESVAGMLRMRHFLNDALRVNGGHIGYYVAPWARRQGLARAALGLALTELAALGETRALLTTNPSNAGSIRVIEGHGGVLEDYVADPNGATLCRYWIDLG